MNKRRIVLLTLAGIVLVVVAVTLPLLAASKRQAQSMSCASQVVCISYSGLLYASERDGHFPTNFICMTNELVTPKVLACPRDGAHKRATGWPSYTDANCSYVIVTPGVSEEATNTVFIRCSIHGHLGYPDTTVFDGVRRRNKFD